MTVTLHAWHSGVSHSFSLKNITWNEACKHLRWRYLKIKGTCLCHRRQCGKAAKSFFSCKALFSCSKHLQDHCLIQYIICTQHEDRSEISNCHNSFNHNAPLGATLNTVLSHQNPSNCRNEWSKMSAVTIKTLQTHQLEIFHQSDIVKSLLKNVSNV